MKRVLVLLLILFLKYDMLKLLRTGQVLEVIFSLHFCHYFRELIHDIS